MSEFIAIMRSNYVTCAIIILAIVTIVRRLLTAYRYPYIIRSRRDVMLSTLSMFNVLIYLPATLVASNAGVHIGPLFNIVFGWWFFTELLISRREVRRKKESDEFMAFLKEWCDCNDY